MASLEVRPSQESDIDYLVKWLNDPLILHWFPMEDLEEVKQASKIWVSHMAYSSVLTIVDKDIPVGMSILYVQPFKKLSHQCLFAIVVDPNRRGQGIGTQLLKSITVLAKEKFHIEMLHLEVYKGNPAIHLYRRLGFIEYGVHRRCLKEPTGKYFDKIMMYKML